LFIAQNITADKMTDFSFASRKEPEYMSHEMVHCSQCDLVYANRPPSQNELERAYHQANYDSTEEALDAARSYIKAIQPTLQLLANKQSVLDQLSFENEVSNIKMFYSKWNKPGLDYIKIPKVYSEITRKVPNVIVMERIFGKTITQIDTDDKDKYALLLAKFNFKSVFYDAIYHGDFHPGNVFFLKENKVVHSDNDEDNDDDDDDDDDDDESPYTYKLGIIDFGITGMLTRELQNVIYNLFHNLYEKNHVGVAHCIINNLIEPKNILTDESKKELVEIISYYSEMHFGKEKYKFLDAEDMITINKILYNYGVQFSKEFCKVELSFAISDSVCKLLSNKTTYIDQLLNIFSNSP
jgi:predicted unusual protein kinase regulating ubiquinone biosynthesis (AarF/ABC1/UbiB family)